MEECASSGMAVAKGLSALERRVTALQGEARVMEMASDREVRAVGLDMDGVLFGTRMSSAVSQVGIGTSLKFMWKTWKLPRREGFFDSLRVPILERDTRGMKVIHQGKPLPSILTAFQMGLVSGAQAEADIVAYYYSADCPLLPAEVAMYMNVAHLLLDPSSMAETRMPLAPGQDLLSHLAELKRDSKLMLFGVTNWDVPSFELLKQQFPDTFAMLSFVVVSGAVHAVKPHPDMYATVLKRLREEKGFEDIEYHNILFVDDERSNVSAAWDVGMHTHLWNPSSDE